MDGVATKDVLEFAKSVLTILSPIAAALWVAFTYLRDQRSKERDRALAEQRHLEELRRDNEKRADDARKEAFTRQLEAQKPFLSKRLELYFETAQVAGRLSTLTPSTKEWAVSDERFWELYWSELSMVESGAVERDMILLGKAVRHMKLDYSDIGRQFAIQEATLNLARAIRSGILESWLSPEQVQQDVATS